MLYFRTMTSHIANCTKKHIKAIIVIVFKIILVTFSNAKLNKIKISGGRC